VPEPEKPAAAAIAPVVSSSELRLKPSAEVGRWHKPVFILFLLAWMVNWILLLLRVELPPEGRWVEALLPVLATATTLLALGRRLPLQNVLMAAALIAGISSSIAAVGTVSGVPFGPFVYSDALGEALFGVVPWTVPLLWVVLIVNGRGVARLVMRPWRKTNYYGFWVIGLTCLLAVMFDLGFEPFAARVKHYWLWQTGNSVFTWHTAPWVNFLGWFVTALGILAFTIPWLINKQPIKQPIDYHPLVVWLLLNLWVATGNATEQLWLAAGTALIGNAVVAVYAIRGARW
jgi:putative membrane protein